MMPGLFHGLLLALTLALTGLASSSAEARVPAKLRVAITFKALTYDRNLTVGRGGALKVGVVTSGGEGLKVAKKTEAEIERVKGARVAGLKLSVTRITVKSGEDPSAAVSRAGVNLLYLTPMSEGMLRVLAKLGSAKKLLTISGERAHAKSFAALTVALSGQKPQIIVNLRLARAQGANFDARLLRLAEVIR